MTGAPKDDISKDQGSKDNGTQRSTPPALLGNALVPILNISPVVLPAALSSTADTNSSSKPVVFPKVQGSMDDYAGASPEREISSIDDSAPVSASDPVSRGVQAAVTGNLAFAIRLQPANTSELPGGAVPNDARIPAQKGQPAFGNKTQDESGAASSRISTIPPVRHETEGEREGSGPGNNSGTSTAETHKPGNDDPKQRSETVEAWRSVESAGATPGLDVATGQPGDRSGSLRESSPQAGTLLQAETTAQTLPMKQISMRVEAAQGQTVDVRLVLRAGDLQIAVQSSDKETTQGLQQGLPGLTSRLNESGYRTEAWLPGQQTAVAPDSASPSGSPSSHQPPSDQSQSHSGQSQQDRGQRDSNQSNRHRWVQALESSTAPAAKSTGEINGIVS